MLLFQTAKYTRVVIFWDCSSTQGYISTSQKLQLSSQLQADIPCKNNVTIIQVITYKIIIKFILSDEVLFYGRECSMVKVYLTLY